MTPRHHHVVGASTNAPVVEIQGRQGLHNAINTTTPTLYADTIIVAPQIHICRHETLMGRLPFDRNSLILCKLTTMLSHDSTSRLTTTQTHQKCYKPSLESQVAAHAFQELQ